MSFDAAFRRIERKAATRKAAQSEADRMTAVVLPPPVSTCVLPYKQYLWETRWPRMHIDYRPETKIGDCRGSRSLRSRSLDEDASRLMRKPKG